MRSTFAKYEHSVCGYKILRFRAVVNSVLKICSHKHHSAQRRRDDARTKTKPNERKKLFTLLDLCVSSLRRGHANFFCIVPILPDVPRRESSMCCELRKRHMATPTPKRGTLLRLCVSSLRRAMPIFSVSLQFYRMLLKRL